MNIKLVPCDDRLTLGYCFNKPKRLMIDGVHRGWVAYNRSQWVHGSNPSGHYLFSLLPSEYATKGSGADTQWRAEMGRHTDLQVLLSHHVPKKLEDGWLPSSEEVPAVLAKADARIAMGKALKATQDAIRERQKAEAQARGERLKREQDEATAHIREAYAELLARPDVTNFQREGLLLAAKRLNLDVA